MTSGRVLVLGWACPRPLRRFSVDVVSHRRPLGISRGLTMGARLKENLRFMVGILGVSSGQSQTWVHQVVVCCGGLYQ